MPKFKADISRVTQKMLSIGPVPLRNKVILAPMSGVTDLPFRRLALRFGAGLVVSEMVASDALVTGHPESLMRAEGEGIKPHVIQLAGKDAQWMAEGARIAQSAGADVIDINMGCPAKKVTSGYSGSALMKDLDHALTLIEATIGAVSVPVTLKMRLGWDETSINAPELAQRAEAAGVQMITVHGRTRSQFYKGKADWQAIKAVRDVVTVPLVANGDLTDFGDADAMIAASGADLVMVGRGAYGRPWLPGHIAHYLATGEKLAAPKGAQLGELICEHYEAMLAHYGLDVGLKAARKHIGWYLEASGTLQHAPDGFMRKLQTSLEPKVVTTTIREWFQGDGAAD
ncbi:tRNA dihydrouridine synthase DusB [Polycladidibacter hongkongensis]|uniref:tRNA dihydrouridine synthase DusB n=1 Tax=Polycladidibacter hongkongensis TaxID=1647556 RepID=UPI000AD0C4A7|nr:tRNA dihydrouridine synthase DusB [Pseudovibrio hongkongensis]